MIDDLDELTALRVQRSDHVAEVSLLGPAKGNAMGPDFWRELPLVFRAADADPEVRAIVLRGSGENFSYGLDLPAMTQRWAEYLDAYAPAAARAAFLAEIRQMQDAVNTIAESRAPVIATVSGRCIGGGIDVITAADIRLASAEALFSVREVKLAIVADLGTLQRLGPIVGEGHARELALTGRDIDAARAQRIGLVNDVYPDPAALADAARALAAEIAANSPLAVGGIKDVLAHADRERIAAGQRYVSAWNAAFLPSKDLGEAITAFSERRAAQFTGE